MGEYVYRVTSKQVMCSDGKTANIAVFAYKPYGGFGSDAINAKMYFRSGCFASEKLEKDGRLTGRIVIGHKDAAGKVRPHASPEGRTVFAWGGATLSDATIGSDYAPVIKDVQAE